MAQKLLSDPDFYQNPESFATYIDFGSQDNYRYVIRNRLGKMEAFFEGDALPSTFNGYDVEWEYNSFYRTKKKFEKALQKK